VFTTRDLAFGALLIALSLAIPLAFGGVLGVSIPPFTATVASHVPLMLAMVVSPPVAVLVGAGSALGFLLRLGPVIGARAAMHIPVGYAGALLVKSGRPYPVALYAVLPLHAALEALIVLPFGFSLYRAGVVVGIGTALHHVVDAAIAIAVVRLLTSMGLFPSQAAPPGRNRAQ